MDSAFVIGERWRQSLTQFADDLDDGFSQTTQATQYATIWLRNDSGTMSMRCATRDALQIA